MKGCKLPIKIDEIAFRLLEKPKYDIINRMSESWLGRQFDKDKCKKVLLIFIPNRLSSVIPHRLALQQFYPFFHYGHLFQKAGIEFRAMPYDALVKASKIPDADAYFIQYPEVMPGAALSKMLARIRQAHAMAPIAFFDWFAPTDLRFADCVEPYVTAYAKKALLRDRAAYVRATKGHTMLEDHYAERLGVQASPSPEWSTNVCILDRLTAAPAFWADSRYLPAFERLDGPPVDTVRDIDLHIRMETSGNPWYTAMRQEALAAASALADIVRLSPSRLTGYRSYMEELRRSRFCFSPFGYGEICWRDYEAILSGAVLVKPDMSHIECVPDIYRAGETYISVRWDMADLREKMEGALADPEGMRRMALRAFDVIKQHLDGRGVVAWTEGLLKAVPPEHAARTAELITK
jgi:hypothetical protein